MITALEQYDPLIYELLKQEEARQSGNIRLIPSENYVSKAVMTATGSTTAPIAPYFGEKRCL